MVQKQEIIADYLHCKTAADYIRSRIHDVPDVGIILGSGLGPLASGIDVQEIIPYSEIPGFPVTTVADHKGNLIFGTLAGTKVLCMQGRFHYYEGYAFEDLAMSIRVLKLTGIVALVLTNAAGAVNLSYRPGDIMIISDHINLTGVNPTRGQDFRNFGERFYDVSNLYDKDLRLIARKCAKRSPLNVYEGVYMFMPGPNFETPAEVRACRLLGADAVGMSTVPEALVAGHVGLKVIGLSVMTNMAAGILPAPLTSEEVNAVADLISVEFSAYVEDLLLSINQEYGGNIRRMNPDKAK